jgi:RNA polymerase sigma factor (sigma-70 family)
MTQNGIEPPDPLADDVALAVAGDRAALDRVVRGVQPLFSRLALRFFGCPRHAEDATQEALVQLVTKLERFEGKSAFTTWAYRVATNKFLSMARSPAEREVLGFDAFDEDLARPGASADEQALTVDQNMLTAEVRIACTLAMLLCLERDARLAYILGAIVELDHQHAADVLECSAATYRKRLERAREAITSLMRKRCGVFDGDNPCKCDSRVGRAIERGHLDPTQLVFAPAAEQVKRFPEVLHQIRRLDEARRAAAIYQSHPDPSSRDAFALRLQDILGPGPGSVPQG